MDPRYAWKESVTVDEVIDLLNDALGDDPDAMQALVETRVPCNQKLADHPTIQVGTVEPLVIFNTKESEEIPQYRVGLLGILNGIFGIGESGSGQIAAEFGVVCEHDCHEAYFEGFKVGDACPLCGSALVTGKLKHFSRIRVHMTIPGKTEKNP